MPSFRLVRILALAFTALLAGASAYADEDDRETTLRAVQDAVERGEIMSLGDLKTIVKKRFPGDIVRVSTSREHGRFGYEFRVLSANGKLIEIEMDAATGEVLEVENE